MSRRSTWMWRCDFNLQTTGWGPNGPHCYIFLFFPVISGLTIVVFLVASIKTFCYAFKKYQLYRCNSLLPKKKLVSWGPHGPHLVLYVAIFLSIFWRFYCTCRSYSENLVLQKPLFYSLLVYRRRCSFDTDLQVSVSVSVWQCNHCKKLNFVLSMARYQNRYQYNPADAASSI